MTIEIIKGDNNAVTDFFSSPSNTPETDDQPIIYAMNDNGYQVPCVDLEFARKLERERDELAALLAAEKATRNSIIEKGVQTERERDEARAELKEYRSIAENIGATKAVSDRDKAVAERDEAREQVKELIYIALRAISLAEIDFENDKFGIVSELRDGVERIKEGSK